MTPWIDVLTIANFVIAIGIVLGGWLAIRSGQGRTSTEIQERVRQALHDENELLQSRVNRVDAENKRLHNVLLLVIAVLKKTRGIELEIDDDSITITDSQSKNGTRTTTMRIGDL